MNTINTKLIATGGSDSNTNTNANERQPLAKHNTAGIGSALGTKGTADRGLALGAHGKTMKTVRIKEEAAGRQPQ